MAGFSESPSPPPNYTTMKLTSNECELIGVLIGDGFIYKRDNHYRFGFTGNQRTDNAYYDYLLKLIRSVTGKSARKVNRFRGVRIVVNSKSYVMRLIEFFELPFGAGKCTAVVIPKPIFNNWDLAKHTLRGIADTDGSVFLSDKPGSPGYPSIEITTTSKRLALQIKELLEKHGFRVSKIRSYTSKLSTVPCFKIDLYGRNNLKMWLDNVGFSNPHKLSIAATGVTLQDREPTPALLS